MSDMHADAEVKEITVDAVVIRADGTREDLGTVARYDRDEPERNLGRVLLNKIRDFRR